MDPKRELDGDGELLQERKRTKNERSICTSRRTSTEDVVGSLGWGTSFDLFYSRVGGIKGITKVFLHQLGVTLTDNVK